MKRALLASVALLAFMLVIAPAFASNVPPNQVNIVNLWTNLGSAPSGLTLQATISGPFTLPSLLNPGVGTYTTSVYSQANGDLVFFYQLNLTSQTGDVQKISTGDWASNILVNAEQWSGGGSVAASGINRLNGVISMYFQNPLVLGGQTSYQLYLYTNATQWTTDTIGIEDGAGTTVAGFMPLAPPITPEPATISLLGVGLAGLATLRKKIRK